MYFGGAMQEKNILLRFLAVPLRHKLAAAGIALAIGSGFLVWSRHDVPRGTIAVLSFDAGAAQRVEPGIMRAKEPAVAFAQFILNDEMARELVKKTGMK